MEFGACYTENGVSFSPPAYIQRYGAVCDIIKQDPRWSGTIQKVVDFGCAELSLFHYLKSIAGLTDILEVDYDGELLERFHPRAEPLFYDHLFQRETPLKVSVLQGSVSDPDYRLIGCDAVVAIELIEHLDVGVFDRLPHNIFGYVKPRIAIVTTPNADFNVLFPNLKDGGYRHYDHRFEWTREQFQDWANNIVSRYPDYAVEVSGLAPGPEGTEHLGCCSQMAVFINQNYTKMENVDPAIVNHDYSNVETTPRPAGSEMNAAGEKIKQNSVSGSTQQWNCDPSPAVSVPPKPDCQAEVDVSPPCSVTSDDPLDENQNQDKLDYKDLVVADSNASPVRRDSAPADSSTRQWDCKVWENEAPAKYYKSIVEYDYPVFVDPRSREQKIIDNVKYKLGTYCNYQHQYYDSEEDLWRIPMPYLLTLCHEFPELTIDQLRMILYNAGYEVDMETLIHRMAHGGSSCQSEEPPYEDNYQGDIAPDNYTNQETWDYTCPSDSDGWGTAPAADSLWSPIPDVQHQVYPVTDVYVQPYATVEKQKFIQTDANMLVEPTYFNPNNFVEQETNALYANEQLALYQENEFNKDASVTTISSQETFTDSNQTQMTLGKDVASFASKQNIDENKSASFVETNESIVETNEPIKSCTTFKSHNTYVINCSANTMRSMSTMSQSVQEKSKTSKMNESIVSHDVSITSECADDESIRVLETIEPNYDKGESKTVEANYDIGTSMSQTIDAEKSMSKTVEAEKSMSKTVEAEKSMSKTVEAEKSMSKTNETEKSMSKTIEAEKSTSKTIDADYDKEKSMSKTNESQLSDYDKEKSMSKTNESQLSDYDKEKSMSKTKESQVSLGVESQSSRSTDSEGSSVGKATSKINVSRSSLYYEIDSTQHTNNSESNVEKTTSKTSQCAAAASPGDSYLTIDSHDSFTESNDTQATLASDPEKQINVEDFCDVSEDQLGIVDLVGEQLAAVLSGKLEDSCNVSCTDERSPSSPLAQFCNASKDKDGTEMLSDSGYLKSQDSPQSPICSESFSNDLITPDKDVSEMVQSTILECIPENLNYVTHNSSTSPKGNAKNSPLRRKSIGPMTTSESNQEFSGCSSMSRPRSLHVCTTTNPDVDHGDFKSDTRFRAVLYESPTNSVPPYQFIGPRNEVNNRPAVPLRHFRQMNEYEEQRPEQHRPNFLDLQNLEVAVLDHQNNNVDFEGNNIDEDERLADNVGQEEEMEAADLLRQRMDIHNENHLGGGAHLPAEQEEEEQRGEIVEEYREQCLGENYGCNPNILPVRFAPPPNIPPATTSTHNLPSSLRTSFTQTDEEEDANILIDSIEKTLSLQSNENIFLDESPCCSKTFYNINATHDRYIDKDMPSTSKKYTSDDSFNLERKKTGHCLTTMLYNPDDFKKIYNRDSDVSLNALNTTSMSNFFKDPGQSHSDLSSSKESSDCNIVESKDTDLGLEGCLTIIGSHLNKCFSSSTFLDWNNGEIKLSDEDSTIDLDVVNEVTAYTSEENVLEPLIVPVEKKPVFSSNIDVDAVTQESTGPPSSSSSRLEQFFSLEEQFVLPDWFVQIMTNNPEIDDEMMNVAAMVFAPERQAGGDGVGVHSYSSTHSSGHASMSSATSHTNQSVVVPMDRQAFSFTDLPFYQPPIRDNYETSSSNSSIDLQLPIDVAQDARVTVCQCDYCQTNNSDNASHHHREENEATATSRPNYNLINSLQQQDNMQDSSDDTYQSHSYRNPRITATANVHCSSPENNAQTNADCIDESQQPNSLLDLPDDLTFRNVDSYSEYEDVASLGSCEFLKTFDFSSRIRGVPSDMSGNYADVETDLDSEAD